jgi:fermentation-respiration switch protein FrsA (DUF1100 family)
VRAASARARSTPSSWEAPTCRVEATVAALKFLLLAAVVGYVAIAALVWFAQDGVIFYPQPAPAIPKSPPGWRVEQVSLQMRDGIHVAGILVSASAARGPLVIYFGGNAQEATGFASAVPELYGERAVLLVNYRGYGASEGRPGEAELVGDGLEIFDWAAKRPDVDPQRIALHGVSLGTGIAVQVAAARPARCVVLTSPFASLLGIAREMHPWLPVSWLLRHPFDSSARAPRVHAPALILMGSADTTVPARHSERLASQWGGPVERVTFEGFGHNDIDINPRYAATIREFLDRFL